MVNFTIKDLFFESVPIYSFDHGLFIKTSDMFINGSHIVAFTISNIDRSFIHLHLSNGNVIISTMEALNLVEVTD